MRRDKCPTGTSWCYACKNILPLKQFYSDKSRANGKMPRCISCCSTAAKPKQIELLMADQTEEPVYNQYESYMNAYNAMHPTFIQPRWNQPTSDEVRAATAARKAILDQWDLEFKLSKQKKLRKQKKEQAA